jgi:hypothetical protein
LRARGITLSIDDVSRTGTEWVNSLSMADRYPCWLGHRFLQPQGTDPSADGPHVVPSGTEGLMELPVREPRSSVPVVSSSSPVVPLANGFLGRSTRGGRIIASDTTTAVAERSASRAGAEIVRLSDTNSTLRAAIAAAVCFPDRFAVFVEDFTAISRCIQWRGNAEFAGPCDFAFRHDLCTQPE